MKRPAIVLRSYRRSVVVCRAFRYCLVNYPLLSWKRSFRRSIVSFHVCRSVIVLCHYRCIASVPLLTCKRSAIVLFRCCRSAIALSCKPSAIVLFCCCHSAIALLHPGHRYCHLSLSLVRDCSRPLPSFYHCLESVPLLSSSFVLAPSAVVFFHHCRSASAFLVFVLRYCPLP